MAKILVIDDDSHLCAVVQQALRRDGHEVLVAFDGKEGLRLVKAETVDLVLTDVIMPEQDGLGVILHLRTLTPPPPFIAFSGGSKIGAWDALNLAEKMGASAVLTKPFQMDELLNVVRATLHVG